MRRVSQVELWHRLLHENCYWSPTSQHDVQGSRRPGQLGQLPESGGEICRSTPCTGFRSDRIAIASRNARRMRVWGSVKTSRIDLPSDFRARLTPATMTFGSVTVSTSPTSRFAPPHKPADP